MEKFDYDRAVAEIEKIAQLVEDPSTGLPDMDKYAKRSAELIAACRAYLRSAQDSMESLDA